ncbi:helix-turn-helix domain-containing protein [uncultured Robinsoniella sp.]|uniref:helix-turn-helix domain-containing protein n=1 Tax=uncultured Robinsoniella sp. TaxID=904190 RepID=UPI00374E81AF
MYSNSGYLNDIDIDILDQEHELSIYSCGNYRFISRKEMVTLRPNGRIDYQLIYVAKGKADFEKNGVRKELAAGSLILYRPLEPQKYYYYAQNTPELFWIHFSGYGAEALLDAAGFKEQDMLEIGFTSEYTQIMNKMIRELQLKRPGHCELLTLYFREFLTLISRHQQEKGIGSTKIKSEIETAVHYFNEHFSQELSIQDYAAANHISTCWFIRTFRQYMGMTPMQYITSIRITKAKELLETTDLTINEIGDLTGYQNALYFSRIFKKTVGAAPTEYRKSVSYING